MPEDLDVDGVCGFVASATSRDDPAVLSEISRRFRVDRARLRTDQNGVYVPRSTFFVEERGVFLARPGVELRDGPDPSFTHVRQCVYRYRISG